MQASTLRPSPVRTVGPTPRGARAAAPRAAGKWERAQAESAGARIGGRPAALPCLSPGTARRGGPSPGVPRRSGLRPGADMPHTGMHVLSHTPSPPFSFSLPCPPPLAETAEELLLRASSKGDRFDGRAFRRSLGKSGKYVRNPVNDEASLAQMEADGTGYSSTGLIAQVSVELRGGEARGRRPACHRLHPRLTPRGACLGDGQTA